MQIRRGENCLELTYCLNIHPGESWSENLAALRTHVPAIHRAVAPDAPFGVGLRLSAQAASELLRGEALARCRDELDSLGLYAMTVNGFPYGPFHGTRVKEDVYAPDWATGERLAYTEDLVGIMAQLGTPGRPVSISTLPGSFRAWVSDSGHRESIHLNLCRAALACSRAEADTGVTVSLAIEPEPDCLWDSTDDMIRLFDEDLPAVGIPWLEQHTDLGPSGALEVLRRHLSVCYDTCHQAARFEPVAAALDRLVEAEVPIGKIQLSAAPVAAVNSDETRKALGTFLDPVYLHQSAIRAPDGTITTFADLPAMLAAARDLDETCELRTHCHIPLCADSAGELGTTRDELDDAFFALVHQGVCPHLEVETYTFDVLPKVLRRDGVDVSVARELKWVLGELAEADPR